MNFYKNVLQDHILFKWLIHLDNLLHFRKNPLGIRWKLIMAIDYKIREEKLQYDINREASKISALSSKEV